jgi:AmiR/NasT family two-component response regulator
MDEEGMSEAEAFRTIQKRAMDERTSMRAVASDLLKA